MIAVTSLTKRFGARYAVRDLTFEVKKGSVCGFLGPNGAGKTTTLRILAGALGKTSGGASICGFDVESASMDARRSMGYMPEAVPLYPEMRVAEYLSFRAELKGVARRERPRAVATAMKKARVDDVASQRIGALSKGYRQRVGLADALVADPPVLVLDEPTSGLDPNQIREVRDVVRDLAGSHTVLLSTHILSEVEAMCDHVVVIHRGRLVAAGTREDITRQRRATSLEVVARGEREACEVAARSVAAFGDVEATDDGGVVTLLCPISASATDEARAEAAEAVVSALVAAGARVRRVTERASSLEDVFAELTRDGGGEAEGEP
ncbi:MAG: ABC transporter ATP-binding protein [Myxococcales bacterium]|nr:ABC transporter ATP-binding protein [Myxococcales bacterium]